MLTRILPTEPLVYKFAFERSLRVFQTVDQWLGLSTTSVLETAGLIPAPGARVVAPAAEDHPLLALLLRPHARFLENSADLLTALVVTGVLAGHGESGMVAALSHGVRMSLDRKQLAWANVLPPLDLEAARAPETWIQACRQHAQGFQRVRDARASIQVQWVDTLERWCALLQAAGDEGENLAAEPVIVIGSAPEGDVPENKTRSVTYLSDEVPVGWDGAQPDVPGTATDHVDERDLDPSDAPESTGAMSLSFPPAGDADGDYPESADEADTRAARTGFKSARQNQWLPHAHEGLSPGDAAYLTAWLIHELAQDSAVRRNAAGLLGLIMATGLPVERVLAMPVESAAGRSAFTPTGKWARRLLREPNAWSPKLTVVPLLRPWANLVEFDLPIALREWLRRVAVGTEVRSLAQHLRLTAVAADVLIRESLQIVRERHHGHQTLGRLQRWLRSAVYAVGHDHVMAHLVAATADDPPAPASYYRAYPVEQLTSSHRNAMTAAGWHYAAATADEQHTDAWVGTRLNPEADELKKMWLAARDAKLKVILDPDQPFHERFNAHQLLSALQIMFLGGLRCVRDPAESLYDFSIIDGLGLVDDKSQSDDKGHRVIPLCEVVRGQIDAQRDHLRRCITQWTLTNPTLAERARLALVQPEARVLPLFFLLNAKGQPRSIHPRDFIRAFKEHWLIPMNAGRHILATELIQRLVGDKAVCNFLGHFDVGTQNLSTLSPQAPADLYRELVPVLDAIAAELDLQPVPTFLQGTAAATDLSVTPAQPPAPMVFGRAARALRRQKFLQAIRLEVQDWVDKRLVDRDGSSLSQVDVDALFKLARDSSPNYRTYAAFARFEHLRAYLLEIVRQHDLDLELPAVAVPVHDHALICAMDAAHCAGWLSSLRQGLKAAWQQEFVAWRRARNQPYVPDAALVVLSLLVECGVIDLRIWGQEGPAAQSTAARAKAKFKTVMRAAPILLLESDRYWIRFEVGQGNSRLYPVPRFLALLLARVPTEALCDVDMQAVVRRARVLTDGQRFDGEPGLAGLLGQIDSGLSLHMPGLIMGYADGSHASVSVEDMCMERASGKPPRAQTLKTWQARMEQAKLHRDDALQTAIRTAEADVDRSSLFSACALDPGDHVYDTSRLFRAVAAACRAGTRRKGTTDAAGPHSGSEELKDRAEGEFDGVLRERFRRQLEAGFNELRLTGARLPPTCAQAADWLLGSAREGYRANEQYAVKSLKNMWHSWGRLLCREAIDYEIHKLTAAEIVVVYLDVIQGSKASKRSHLLPLVRSFHRYLMDHHGACGIDWAGIAAACGAGPGRVDANLIHESEYLAALRLLCQDRQVEVRTARLHAACLVLLYRCGLRIEEVISLRSSDLVYRHKRWHVRVARTIYAGVKSDAGVRRVPIVERLTAAEHRVLRAWRGQVDGYLDHRGSYPLFTQQANAAPIVSQRAVSRRLVEALHAATSDQTIRVHHCRHSWATRLLRVLLMDEAAIDRLSPQLRTEHKATVQQVRMLLTGESHPTRRALWGAAALLGHSSPLETLHSYSHEGHLLMRDWLEAKWWRDSPILDPGVESQRKDVDAFAAGLAAGTWDRRVQRAREAGRPVPSLAQEDLPVGADNLSEGARVARQLRLPALRRRARFDQLKLFEVDRVIDHARRFGHTRGLSEALFEDHEWVRDVINQAHSVCLDSRGNVLDETKAGWWLESSDVEYSLHERRQVRAALRRLQRMPPALLVRHVEALVGLYEVGARCLVLSQPAEFDSAVAVMGAIAEGPRDLRMLIPSTRDEAAAQRAIVRSKVSAARRRSTDGSRTKISLKGVARPRVLRYRPIWGDQPWQGWRSRAADAKVAELLHGDVPESRGGGRNAFERSMRVGLRVQENAISSVRSAKVAGRVFLVLAVASRMARLSDKARK